MERAVPEGRPFWPRGELNHVLSRSAPCTRNHRPRSRHTDRTQNEWNTCFTNTAKNGCLPREGQRAESKQTKAESSRNAHGGQHSDEEPKTEIAAGFSRVKIGSHIAQLRNSDFHSPRQLTSSSLGKFTTASDSMLRHGEGDITELSATAVSDEKRLVKNFTGEGCQTHPQPRVSSSYDGEKNFQSEAIRCLSTKEFRRALSRKANCQHSALAQLESSKCPSFQRLLTVESLPATPREKQCSIPEGTSSTRSDQLSISASVGIEHQPEEIRTDHAPREGNIVSITSRRKCALVTTGAPSADVSARTNKTDNRQFPPSLEPRRSWQRRARHASSSDRCETRSTKKAPNNPHPQVALLRPGAADGSSYTSEYQHSSTDLEMYSDASADGLSWVDYRFDAEQTLCNTARSANSCRSIRGRTLPKTKTESRQQAEVPGGQLCERAHLKSANTKTSFSSQGNRRDAESSAPQKKPACVASAECLTQKAYDCERGYGSHLESDRTAPKSGCAAGAECDHQRRGSWASATRWKARLDFSRSHSRRDESSCEHELRMGRPRCREHRNNCTTKVSQALRRKMGDAVNRLRCRGTRTSVKQEQPTPWCLHDYRDASPTIPSHVGCRSQKESHRMDTHEIHRMEVRESLRPKGQSQTQIKTPWADSGRRDSDTAEPTQNKTTTAEKREVALGPRPSTKMSVCATADREKAPSQLQRYYPLSSASVEEPNMLDISNQNSKSEPFTNPHAIDLGESEIRDSPSGSQFGSSMGDGRFMRLDRASAGTTLSTSAVGSEKRFETHRRHKGKPLRRQKTPASALEPERIKHLLQAPCACEIENPSHSGVQAIKTGGSLSHRLSDVMTEASSERMRNCSDTSENEDACHSEDISLERHSSSQAEKLPTLAHKRRAALASITRSQSLDSGGIKRESSQCTRKHRTRGGDSAITLSDIEASIDWIVEARSNPRLLRAARELLLRREHAERLAARNCYRCRIDRPPLCYPNINSGIHSSAGGSLKTHYATLIQSSQTVSLEESTDDGASSGQSSFDSQPSWCRKITATQRGRQFEAERGLPWISLCEMRTAQTHESSRHAHDKEALTWSSDSESDSRIQKLRWTTKSGHRRYPQNDLRKTFLCYAPSDVAWNMDQLM